MEVGVKTCLKCSEVSMSVLVKHVRHLPVWGDLLSFTVPGGEKIYWVVVC